MSGTDARGWEDFLNDPSLACPSIDAHFDAHQSLAQKLAKNEKKCEKDNDDNDNNNKNYTVVIPADSFWELVKLGLAPANDARSD